jgi:hypothetical protein
MALAILICSVSLAIGMGGGGGGSQKTLCGFEGKVTDDNGKTLKGVEILLIPVDAAEVQQAKLPSESNGKKNLSATTSGSGRYRFVAVRPGWYRVRYSIDGYQSLERLIEFKRGSKDSVLDIRLREIASLSAAGGKQ